MPLCQTGPYLWAFNPLSLICPFRHLASCIVNLITYTQPHTDEQGGSWATAVASASADMQEYDVQDGEALQIAPFGRTGLQWGGGGE